MIKIKRIMSPACLRKSKKHSTKSDYNNPQVRCELFNMQHAKCCYCEKNLAVLSKTVREVDHYVPHTHTVFKDKSGNTLWHLANRWENLLLSCKECNLAKLNRYPFSETGEPVLIDPSRDNIDPEENISFNIEDNFFISYKATSSLGQSTIDTLKFRTRIELLQSLRKKRYEIEGFFVDLLNAIESCNKSKIQSQKGELRKATSAKQDFCSFARKCIQMSVHNLNEVLLPKLEKQLNKKLNKMQIDFFKGYEFED